MGRIYPLHWIWNNPETEEQVQEGVVKERKVGLKWRFQRVAGGRALYAWTQKSENEFSATRFHK